MRASTRDPQAGNSSKEYLRRRVLSLAFSNEQGQPLKMAAMYYRFDKAHEAAAAAIENKARAERLKSIQFRDLRAEGADWHGSAGRGAKDARPKSASSTCSHSDELLHPRHPSLSCSRCLGSATATRRAARSPSEAPRRSATPCSVTIRSGRWRGAPTSDVVSRRATMREVAPPDALASRAKTARPLLDNFAPAAKAGMPPTVIPPANAR